MLCINCGQNKVSEKSSTICDCCHKIKKNQYKCNWCFMKLEEESNKPYCYHCEKIMHKECSTCHRPFPNTKLFTLSNEVCNACRRKELGVKINNSQSVFVNKVMKTLDAKFSNAKEELR
jgi:hypothetical protein